MKNVIFIITLEKGFYMKNYVCNVFCAVCIIHVCCTKEGKNINKKYKKIQ